MSSVSSKRTAIALPSVHPRASGIPCLVVMSGPELGRRIELGAGNVEIGRAEDATLRVDSDAVSRKHARVQRSGDRTFVTDLGSTNGTYINDARIRQRELREGDQLRVGKIVLKYTECAIEAEYHEQIFSMASVDSLTGAFNKRYFNEMFEKAVSEAGTRGRGPSLILFDVDHFKYINDTQGHLAGDIVLKKLSQVVLDQVRKSDVFCRVGGEEFALLLPETPLSIAREVAEFLRAAVERTDFSVEEKTLAVTISLGVGQHEVGQPVAAFYERVDVRLYEAKHRGRNRVC